jgi:hypothetical protein
LRDAVRLGCDCPIAGGRGSTMSVPRLGRALWPLLGAFTLELRADGATVRAHAVCNEAQQVIGRADSKATREKEAVGIK